MQPVLLDTCAAIWILEDQPIAEQASRLLDDAHAAAIPTFVSPITAWEIGLLASRRRLKILTTPERWFSRLIQYHEPP